MIRSDVHMHSYYSADSDAPMEEMIRSAKEKGLEYLCFTDHQDRNCYLDGVEYAFDTGKYRREIESLRERFSGDMEIGFGAELGLMPEEPEYCMSYPKAWDFDFVIGSVHFIQYEDPYYPEFFRNYTSDLDVYRRYFDVMLSCIRRYDDFDVLGHLDYIVRYGKEWEKSYLAHDFSEVTDEMFKILIERGQGLEVNTAGLKYGLPFAHPAPRALSRYRELGGEIVTVGADAHCPEHVAYGFAAAEAYLKENGFRYYARYRNRVPEFLPLG